MTALATRLVAARVTTMTIHNGQYRKAVQQVAKARHFFSYRIITLSPVSTTVLFMLRTRGVRSRLAFHWQKDQGKAWNGESEAKKS